MAPSLAAVAVAVCLCALAVATPTTPFVSNAYTLPKQYLVKGTDGAFHVVASKANTTLGTVVGEAQYNASMMDLGWDYLRVAPDAKLVRNPETRRDAYYYAGYLEGFLTYDVITLFYGNNIYPVNTQAMKWVKTHINFMYDSVKKNPTDAFWQQVGAILSQLEGMEAGYNAVKKQQLTFLDFFLLNFGDEIGDVYTHIKAMTGQSPPFRSMRNLPRGHCSALIKVTPTDLFVAHDTWSGFSSMAQRMFKTYEFETTVTMSSSPSTVASGDDWYMTSHELAVQETTNGFYNNTLFKAVLPDSVSEFIRVMAANFLATDAEKWTRYFASYNSGTYNNQYMVVDYKKYVPGSSLEDNTFWVAEQMPGYVERRDQTEVLRRKGYWASYNIPFYDYIFAASGNLKMEQDYGTFYSYTKYARPEIFRRNESSITGLADMMRMLRYNDYKVDPFSLIPNCSGTPGNKCSPQHSSMLSIASRGDLMTVYNTTAEMKAHYGPIYDMMAQGCFGAIDTKISRWSDRKSLRGYAVCGPTNDQQPVFKYGSAVCPESIRPKGSPKVFDFPWVEFNVLEQP